MKKLSIFAEPRSAPDYAFLGATVALVIFGLVMLASASSDVALKRFGESYHYLFHQMTYGLTFGLAGFLLTSFVYYRFWEKFAVPILIFSIVLLLLVFTPLGFSVKGGERWIALAGISFQPGEFVKLALIIYLASWLARVRERSESVTRGLIPFLVLVGSVVGLLIQQPATTTSIILAAAALILYFMGGARLRFVALIALLVMLAFSLLIYFTPYRLERVLTLFDPSADPLGAGYHANEALLAIGSGGLTGVGFGQSDAKISYLPEAVGDSIFAIIAEEFGFIGAMVVVALFTVFVLRGFAIAKRAPDAFGRLLAIGFVSIIGLQAFVNMGAISGILPLTGVPLPFISYGGTALATFLTMAGMVVNISRHRR